METILDDINNVREIIICEWFDKIIQVNGYEENYLIVPKKLYSDLQEYLKEHPLNTFIPVIKSCARAKRCLMLAHW